MLKNSKHISLSIFFSILDLTALGQTTKLDLSTAKKYAIENNFGVKAQEQELEEISSRRNRARSKFLPEIGIQGGSEASISGSNKDGSAFSYGYLNYNIFRGFRDINASEAAEYELNFASIEYDIKKFQIGLATEEVFHNYLYKAALIRFKEEEIQLNEKHRKQVERSRMMGSTSETDVMEFKLKSAALNSELVALKQELDDARSELKRLLGEKIGENIRPTGDLQHIHVTDDLANILKKVQLQSVEVRQKSEQLKVAQAEEAASKGRWLPEVEIEARTGILRPEERLEGEKGVQSSFLIIGTWPLFNGGDAYWETREKIAGKQKAEFQLKDSITQTVRESEIGFRTLKTIESRADVEKDNAEFATKYYKSVLSEYQRGIKNSSDLSNAAEKMSEANQRRVDLDYEFIKSRIALERTLGFQIATQAVNHVAK
jgi:outer membrane protein TolC